MSSVAPLVIESFSLPRSLLPTQPLSAALDQGGSLLKLVFVDKKDTAGDSVTVHVHLYSSAHLDAALAVIRQCCHFPLDLTGAVLNITGVGYSQIHGRVEEELGVKTKFSDEFICQARGAVCLVKHSLGDPFYPSPTPEDVQEKGFLSLVAREREKNAQRFTVHNSSEECILPANFLVLGSAPVVMHVDKAGKPRALAMCFLGGKSFLGLAGALLGTADYDEVMALAAAGDIRACDLQVKDILGSRNDYGTFDADLPYLPFGKVFLDIAKEPRREDVAASLLSVFSQVAYLMAVQGAYATGVSRFYVSGNWTRSEVARRSLVEQWTLTVPERLLEFQFLKSGALTGLGALLHGVEI